MTAAQESTPNKEGSPKGGKSQWEAEQAWKWWRALQPPQDGGRRGGANRAALAKLRRCPSWIEAAAQPETALLFNSLGGGNEARFQRVAVLAAVLAHVRNDDKNRSVAEACGPMGGDEAAALLSALRLRRLLTTTGDDAILTAFRRLVALMGDTANVADLAKLILNWDGEWGEKTRMRFAFGYWQAGAAAPANDSAAPND